MTSQLETEAPHPHTGVWQDDSASIPRERNLMIAWWIALALAVGFILTNVIFKPDPYAEIINFIGDGLMVTFQLTITSMLFALFLGLLAGLGRTSPSQPINVAASLYVEIIRGIPLLVQLFWIYYALSKFLRLGPSLSAITGLTVCYGAYIGETFRAGIQSISKGQMEAARALGLTRGQAMRHVIIPQAVRVVLPPVGNEFIAMLKDSSLVSVLAISDMLRRGREYASRTFAYFETYTMVALVYLLVTLVFSRVVHFIEQGMSRQQKDAPVTVMHRLSAVVIDFVIIDLIATPIISAIRGIAVDPAMVMIMAIAAIGALTVVYLLGFWSKRGQTPGMMAVGLRLVNVDGVAPSVGKAAGRLLVSLLPLPGVSLIWAHPALGGKPLQDRLTRTTMVRV